MSVNFKVGDTVAIESGYRMTSYTLLKIVRETPTQWVLENETRINKKDNTIVGKKYSKAYEVTQRIKDVVERNRLVRNIQKEISYLYSEGNCIVNHNISELKEVLNKLSEARTVLRRKGNE